MATTINSIEQSIAKAVENIKNYLDDSGGGRLVSHFREALGISPEIAHADMMDLNGTITTSTNITQPDTVRVHSEMDFEVYGISAYCAIPATTPADITLCTFNIRESGRNFDMFSTDQNLATFVTPSGCLGPYIFERGLYKFRAGSDIKMTLKAATGWAQARKVGVCLFGNLIRRK